MSYIHIRAKQVTSEASYERIELRAKRVMSEASINQLGVRGAHNFFVTFLLRIFWKIFFMIIDQIFEDNNETINNICKSNTQKLHN